MIDLKWGAKLADIQLSGHPESFQLEKNGDGIFVNVPNAEQIAVIGREKKAVVATWPMKEFRANFPTALDEAGHRLFVGCRRPARLVVLNTTTGEKISNVEIGGDTDDVYYDGKRKLIYVSCGGGSIDVINRLYAARGIKPVMPPPELCRVASGFLRFPQELDKSVVALAA